MKYLTSVAFVKKHIDLLTYDLYLAHVTGSPQYLICALLNNAKIGLLRSYVNSLPSFLDVYANLRHSCFTRCLEVWIFLEHFSFCCADGT